MAKQRTYIDDSIILISSQPNDHVFMDRMLNEKNATEKKDPPEKEHKANEANTAEEAEPISVSQRKKKDLLPSKKKLYGGKEKPEPLRAV